MTNALLAIEDLQQSSIISPETRRAIEKVQEALEEESSKLVEAEQVADETNTAD